MFATCRHFLRTVPALVYSSVDVEDVDTAAEDHIYDELRYVCMENPYFPPLPAAVAPPVFDPLADEPPGYQRYNFYLR